MNRRNRYRRKEICRQECAAAVPLSLLGVGERGRVIKICCQRTQLRRRMLDMGITVGTVIEIKRKAPLGDPVDLAIRDYHLCLRLDDLSGIMVEVIR